MNLMISTTLVDKLKQFKEKLKSNQYSSSVICLLYKNDSTRSTINTYDSFYLLNNHSRCSYIRWFYKPEIETYFLLERIPYIVADTESLRKKFGNFHNQDICTFIFEKLYKKYIQ